MQGDNTGGYRGIQGDTGGYGHTPLEQARQQMLEGVRQVSDAQVRSRVLGYTSEALAYEQRLWHVLAAYVTTYRVRLDEQARPGT